MEKENLTSEEIDFDNQRIEDVKTGEVLSASELIERLKNSKIKPKHGDRVGTIKWGSYKIPVIVSEEPIKDKSSVYVMN